MLAAGLWPLLGLGALGGVALARALSLSPRRLDATLQRADAALQRSGADPALRDELRLAQISLVQAELARQSLSKLAPAALGGALAVGALLLALGALALGRALSRPVEELAADMGRVAQGQLEL